MVVVASGLKEMPETEIPGHCPQPRMISRWRNVQREILRIAHEVTSLFITIPNHSMEEVEWIKPGAMGLLKTDQRDL
jgi:hypothetical protein